MNKQKKGRWIGNIGKTRYRKWKRETMQRTRKKKKYRANTHGREKTQGLKGLIDGNGGSVVVDLSNLSTKHLFI